MKRIGILFGVENSFPGALVEHINAQEHSGIRAEFVQTGAVYAHQAPDYAVIVDRISHDTPFYRSFLKQAALNGTTILNNPFWWSADDKFFNYALAARLGIAVPPTAMLPHKHNPSTSDERALRNLEYPLQWEQVFSTIGFPGYLKPIDSGGGRNVTRVHSPEEFFQAYDQSGSLCLVYQAAVDYEQYYRVLVVGPRKVRVLSYDPSLPYFEQYSKANFKATKPMIKRMEQDAQRLCHALGYDINTVEFAVKDGVPVAIDFMNPAPDADLRALGQENFDWFVHAVAELAVARAKKFPSTYNEQWSRALAAPTAKPAGKKKLAVQAKPSS